MNKTTKILLTVLLLLVGFVCDVIFVQIFNVSKDNALAVISFSLFGGWCVGTPTAIFFLMIWKRPKNSVNSQ